MNVEQPQASTMLPGTMSGRIDLLIELNEEQPSAGGHYQHSRIMTVEAGQSVARVQPQEEQGPDAPVCIGANVSIAADGRTLIADATGQLCLDHGRIWIEKALEIDGDVDFATGNIDFANDVVVRGSILDLFQVTSGGSVLVGKTVEAATVRCGCDLVVRGGIAGKEKGSCVATRDIRARYVSNAHLEAGRNIVIESQVSNSVVSCGGRLRVDGPILAGQVSAVGGIRCDMVGCESGLPTILSAGIDDSFERSSAGQVAEIEHKLLQARKVRDTVEPLLRNQKQLTAPQKEKATELLFEASEVEEQAAKKLAELRAQFEHIRACGKQMIHVKQRVNAGVTIRLPGVEAIIAFPIAGPVQFVPRELAGQIRIAAVHVASGAAMPLETRPRKEPASMAVQRLLARNGS